ncbi:uncharacterized protein BYT42DRAFT_645704 [Radiomyces spectabilis]|uniref:uncharacterized protein n=1 Tax=Radiomyces spectabilis TaxID=64574 RepID=UPI00221F3DDA|nr:uncharacterized protein BYT42DRAFT_645704 [Radiomyces spectabilis]KAI8376035.1 hypothetical protein BYT42DRAFT_645704 [Radiomyces spectabilis]
MTTLEKPSSKRQRSMSQSYVRMPPSSPPMPLVSTDDVIQQLMEETVNYDGIDNPSASSSAAVIMEGALSSEVAQSLQSVKQVCLVALDSLLRKMVIDLPDPSVSTTRETRRLSDSSLQLHPHHRLLDSITYNTTRLTSIYTDKSSVAMKRSESMPANTMSDIQRLLDQHQPWIADANNDYSLCCALATLLRDVYRMLELSQFTLDEASPACPPPNLATDHVYVQLQQEVAQFQRDRAAGLVTIESNASAEIAMLWNQLEHLMNVVNQLVQERRQSDLPPPAYTTVATAPGLNVGTCEKSPPRYSTVHGCVLGEKSRYDLDYLLTAIDRLTTIAPQLSNQRVTMTQRQTDELAAASFGKSLERLSQRRMDNQRASLPPLSKHDMLRDLLRQICKSASRTFDNQRVHMGADLQRKLDVAALSHLLDRIDRGRLVNQDYISPEERLLQDMTSMLDLLDKSLNRPGFAEQRYELSPRKERHLFINSLWKKVDRLEARRMSSQDAALPKGRGRSTTTPVSLMNNPEAKAELAHLLDHLCKSTSHMDNQRASFTPSSTTLLSSLV